MEEVHKKINWHNEVHTYWRQFLTSHMMVTKNPQNVHRKCFWTILVTFIFDVKIDVKMCEPHYVNLFFLWTSSIVYVFDFLTFDIFLTIWHLFDNLTSFWHMNNGAHGQWGTSVKGWLILHIEVRHLGGRAHGPIGHMGNRALANRAHGQSGILLNATDRDGGPWAIGHMGNRAHG